MTGRKKQGKESIEKKLNKKRKGSMKGKGSRKEQENMPLHKLLTDKELGSFAVPHLPARKGNGLLHNFHILAPGFQSLVSPG